jgi:hypothetical protein
MKRWLLHKMVDFDLFTNLRNSGIEITVSVEPKVITVAGIDYKYAGKRTVEVRTETQHQEMLLLLALGGYVTLIEERTEPW